MRLRASLSVIEINYPVTAGDFWMVAMRTRFERRVEHSARESGFGKLSLKQRVLGVLTWFHFAAVGEIEQDIIACDDGSDPRRDFPGLTDTLA